VLPKKYGDKVEVTSRNLHAVVPAIPSDDPHAALRAYQQLINGDNDD
jgi:hypothetical protein